jgi:hypothetical protein
MGGDVFLATGAQNPPSASLTRQSRFDPRSPQAAGHFFSRLIFVAPELGLAWATLAGKRA